MPLALSWHVLLSQGVQQQRGKLRHGSVCFRICTPCAEGLPETFDVRDQLLALLVVRPCEEGTDVGFDRDMLGGIRQRADGPARHALRIKRRFPPCGGAKEGNKVVRDVLEVASTESPKNLAQGVVCLHRRSPSRRRACTGGRGRASHSIRHRPLRSVGCRSLGSRCAPYLYRALLMP